MERMKVTIERLLVFYYFVMLGGLILLAEVPETLRIKYLEARVANAEAVARFEQSLTAQQKAWRDEAGKQQTALQEVEKAIQQSCTDADKLPTRKPNGEPTCADKPVDSTSGPEQKTRTPISEAKPKTGSQ